METISSKSVIYQHKLRTLCIIFYEKLYKAHRTHIEFYEEFSKKVIQVFKKSSKKTMKQWTLNVHCTVYSTRRTHTRSYSWTKKVLNDHFNV